MTQNIENSIKKIFLKVFASELKRGLFDFDKTQDKFQNWDSFSHMELVSAVENELGISLDIEDVVSIRSPRDFVNVIKKKKKVK